MGPSSRAKISLSRVVPARPLPRFVGAAGLVPTPGEQRLFDRLLSLRAAGGAALAQVEMRVVGGWVRDKLLGLAPGDVDVALSRVTGAQFAAAAGLESSLVARNPAKSKHLETCVARVEDCAVDLNHLRSEEYAHDSRVPSAVVPGTPLQDALRRDCSFNALYYNLDSRQVEDPLVCCIQITGKGRLASPECWDRKSCRWYLAGGKMQCQQLFAESLCRGICLDCAPTLGRQSLADV